MRSHLAIERASLVTLHLQLSRRSSIPTNSRLANWAVPRRPCQNYGTRHSLPDAYREQSYGAVAENLLPDPSLHQSPERDVRGDSTLQQRRDRVVEGLVACQQRDYDRRVQPENRFENAEPVQQQQRANERSKGVIANPFLAVFIHESVLGAVSDPHRGYPDNLPILLFAADVVITGFARDRGIVYPRELHFSGAGLRGIHIGIVFDDMHLRELRRARQLHPQGRRRRGRKGVTHNVVDAAHVRQDVVGGGVNVALLESIEHGLAGQVLYVEVAVTDVRGDVV